MVALNDPDSRRNFNKLNIRENYIFYISMNMLISSFDPSAIWVFFWYIQILLPNFSETKGV